MINARCHKIKKELEIAINFFDAYQNINCKLESETFLHSISFMRNDQEINDTDQRVITFYKNVALLIQLRKEIRSKINGLTDALYYRNEKILTEKEKVISKALKTYISLYLLLQDAFIRASNHYINILTEREKKSYWKQYDMDSGEKIQNELEQFMKKSIFKDMQKSNKNKAISYICSSPH